jgi:Zn-dependent protease/CBS domain-containing protein
MTANQLKIFGIPLKVGASSLLGIAFLAYLFVPRYQSLFEPTLAWTAAVGLAIVVFVTVLAHELGHALSARALGAKVSEISLYALGGVTRFERAGSTASRDLVIAAAGPAVTLAIAAISYIAAELVGTSVPLVVEVTLIALAQISLILAIFNLAPALPLDGGVIVSSAVWGITKNKQLGIRFAAVTGLLIAILILASPYFIFTSAVSQSWVFYVFSALIAAWIGATSIRAWQEAGAIAKIPQLQTRDLVRKAIPISGDVTVAEGVRQARDNKAGALVVCSASGVPEAIVTESEVRRVPVAKRPWTSLASIMSPLTDAQKVLSSTSGEAILRAIYESRRPSLLVTDDQDRIVGVVTSDDLNRVLKSA